MAGNQVAIPAALAGYAGGSRGEGSAAVNWSRIIDVAHRLAMHVCAQPKINVEEFDELCFLLARDIDFAVANQDVPTKVPELPSLLKQVCQRKFEPPLQTAIMVLMMSVKSACKNGWFSEKDSEDLFHHANAISGNFRTATDFKSKPSDSQSIIPKIMTRFFPTLKMGQILVFLEVKPGYGVFMNDFWIPKNVEFSQRENVRLLVVQVDNTETSSCLISPPEVSFLLNGSEVAKRTTMFMDSGPQVPTVVSSRNGTNLLQVVGQFNGNYIIAVAYMSTSSIPDPATQPTLLNFLQPAPALEDPESDIIEGPSRISLNCPISFKCIRTPVKGHLCKHLQCFDYHNYVDINSRRPSWRCPHCNQPVCFTDIRIDQNIVKVLKEVRENTTHVIIYSDGSWKAIMDRDVHNDEKIPTDKSLEFAEGDMLDLTALDDEMDEVGIGDDAVDQKPFRTNYQGQPYTKNPSNFDHTSHEVDDFWTGIYLSTFELGTSSSTSNLQTGGVVSNHTPISMPSPVLTDALIPASVMQGGVSSPGTRTLQHYQFGNSDFQSIVSHTSGTPIAVQAAPALATSRDSPAQSLINRNAVPFNRGMQEQFSMSSTNMLQLQHSFASVHPAQQFVGLQGPGQIPDPYRGSLGFATEPQLFSNQPGMLNQRATSVTSNSRGLTSARTSFQTQIQGQHAPSIGAVQQSFQTARPVQISQNAALLVNPSTVIAPPGAFQHGNISGPVPVNLPSYPMGRMRGSLSGQAYANALRQHVIRPAQQVQANMPPQLQALIANRFAIASAMRNHSSTG